MYRTVNNRSLAFPFQSSCAQLPLASRLLLLSFASPFDVLLIQKTTVENLTCPFFYTYKNPLKQQCGKTLFFQLSELRW